MNKLEIKDYLNKSWIEKSSFDKLRFPFDDYNHLEGLSKEEIQFIIFGTQIYFP